jgi:AAA domain
VPTDAEAVVELATPAATQAIAASFFDRNTEQRREIIEGLIREQQLIAFAGPYGIGKSPTLADIAMHVLSGSPWCGRNVERRPVIHFDLETPAPVYKANLRNIAALLNVPLPRVPDELTAYLEHDKADEPGTKALLAALEQARLNERFALIEASLTEKPNALVIIDPLELLFRIDTGKKQHVLALYGALRRLLSKYPEAAMLITFNLRKWKKDGGRPDLLAEPREWMEEVCGTLDILNRADVRLGMDIHDEEVRVLNGIRRGEDMHPLLIRPVSIGGDGLAGFELCPPQGVNLRTALTTKQFEYWNQLPDAFRFEEVADNHVPRTSLSRLLNRAKSLGLIEQNDGRWQKKGIGETSAQNAINTIAVNSV